jgi:hypothetical protein
MPICFEPNRGQTDAQVQYLARGPGYTVFLTATEAVLTAQRARQGAGQPRTGEAGKRPAPQPQAAVVRMQLIDSNPAAQAHGVDPLPGIASYFLGNDPSTWRTHIPTYARVQYQDVYPGIGLVYYGNPQQLEYDFVVGPGADPSQIRLRFAGAESLLVDAEGELVVEAAERVLLLGKPVVYQNVAGDRREVAASFVVHGTEVSFSLGSYDRSRPLVIDPVLSYSTFLGGSGGQSGDYGNGIAVDAAGNVYVTGYAWSPDFPTANALQPTLRAFNATNAFVAKLTADGSALVYSTYLGGSGGENGTGIAVDAAGNAYVTGWTSSRNFPVVNPLQPSPRGNFLAKLTPDGSALAYSTFFGGDTKAIAVDAAGSAYVTGSTSSTDFPSTAYFGPPGGGAFLTKLDPTGSSLVYSTIIGGCGANGIAVDGAGNAYITGSTSSPDFPTVNPLQPGLNGSENAFMAKLTADGLALVYSTYLGGSDFDQGLGIAVDQAGNAYITGWTTSTDFPTASAFQPVLSSSEGNAFVVKTSADGFTLVYSTYLGGNGFDKGQGIAVDQAGNAYVTGSTSSSDFPTVKPLQPALGGEANAFVAELAADGSALLFSSYLGGGGYDQGQSITVDASGNIYLTGQSTSVDFPTVNALQPVLAGPNGNAFVTKISP